MSTGIFISFDSMVLVVSNVFFFFSSFLFSFILTVAKNLPASFGIIGMMDVTDTSKVAYANVKEDDMHHYDLLRDVCDDNQKIYQGITHTENAENEYEMPIAHSSGTQNSNYGVKNGSGESGRKDKCGKVSLMDERGESGNIDKPGKVASHKPGNKDDCVNVYANVKEDDMHFYDLPSCSHSQNIHQEATYPLNGENEHEISQYSCIGNSNVGVNERGRQTVLKDKRGNSGHKDQRGNVTLDKPERLEQSYLDETILIKQTRVVFILVIISLVILCITIALLCLSLIGNQSESTPDMIDTIKELENSTHGLDDILTALENILHNQTTFCHKTAEINDTINILEGHLHNTKTFYHSTMDYLSELYANSSALEQELYKLIKEYSQRIERHI